MTDKPRFFATGRDRGGLPLSTVAGAALAFWGLAAVVVFAGMEEDQRNGYFVFAGILSLLPFAMMWWYVVLKREWHRRDTITQPWRLRPDWAAGEIVPRGRDARGKRVAGIVLVVVGLLSLVSLAFVGSLDPAMLVMTAVPLALGAGLIAAGARAARAARLGTPRLHLGEESWWLGQQAYGEVTVPGSVHPESGFEIQLRCFILVHSKSAAAEQPLWQDTRTAVTPTIEAGQTRVPVAFGIPGDQPETDAIWRLTRKHFWVLRLVSRDRSQELDAEFDVPVFRLRRE